MRTQPPAEKRKRDDREGAPLALKACRPCRAAPARPISLTRSPGTQVARAANLSSTAPSEQEACRPGRLGAVASGVARQVRICFWTLCEGPGGGLPAGRKGEGGKRSGGA